MRETIKQIQGDFVVLDLGSAHAAGILRNLPEVTSAVTLVEIDMQLADKGEDSPYFRRIQLGKAVAGSPGKRLFRKRVFPDCSSFLEPSQALIHAYGLESYFAGAGSCEVECETLTALLRQHGLTRVDFLKTDLEGMDAEVLRSDPGFVRQALCIRCELRFQPFFEGEPPFHETAAYLRQLGFDLIWMRPTVWKYRTAHRSLQRDGRWAWADVVFFLSPDQVKSQFGDESWKMFAKQIILARLVGLNNYAEHLLQETGPTLPAPIHAELARFIKPPLSLPRLAVAGLNRLPFGWMVIGLCRRIFDYGSTLTAVYRDEVVHHQ